MDKQLLVNALITADSKRARSMQTAIGVSSLGGCRRAVWHNIKGDKGTNPTTRLPAIMGTAIHHTIEQAFAGVPGYLIEERVEIEGYPPATIDFYDIEKAEVIDWKTITLKGAGFFVSQQKRWQVQTYAYLLSLKGHPVKTVTLVGIPRDGNENDIVIHSEPYDEAVALEALAWLEDVRTRTEAPAPERDAVSWCQKYCDLYGTHCNGLQKDLTGAVITDEQTEKAAQRYVEVNKQIKLLEAEKDAAKFALEGAVGVTMDGIKISWSQVDGRATPDLDAIRNQLGVVPMKTGAPSIRLNVR